MTRDEFIDAVNRFEKLERTQREFSDEIDKVLCKYTDNQNCTFTSYCTQACELGIYNFFARKHRGSLAPVMNCVFCGLKNNSQKFFVKGLDFYKITFNKKVYGRL